MRYVIRMKGHPNSFCQMWFEHLAMTHEDAGATVLSGQVQGQSVFDDVLAKIRDLGAHALLPSDERTCVMLEERMSGARRALLSIASLVQMTPHNSLSCEDRNEDYR